MGLYSRYSISSENCTRAIIALCPELERELEMLGENAVLNVFEAANHYQHHPDRRVQKAMGSLMKKINNFCSTMAAENEDLVTINFNLQILAKHAEITDARFRMETHQLDRFVSLVQARLDEGEEMTAKVLKLLPRLSMKFANKHPSLGRLYIDYFNRHAIPKGFESIDAVRKTI